MSDLNPCNCGCNIDEKFVIHNLASNLGHWKIAVAMCDFCGEAVPFRYHFTQEIDEMAVKAWNNINKPAPMSNDMPDVIYAASYKLRNDRGIWFDKKINHVSMPKDRYYSESCKDRLIKEAEERQREKDAGIAAECRGIDGEYIADKILNAGGE